MIILGIDPGSRRTGFAVLEADSRGCLLRGFGALELTCRAPHPERLEELYRRLRQIMRQHRPHVCALEMPVYGRDPQAMLKLGRAQAAAMLAAAHEGVPVVEYLPAQVKKAVTGRGSASKEQVWRTLCALLGLSGEQKPPSSDASDALAVAYCHAHRDQASARKPRRGWKTFVEVHADRISLP
ncbi:MAG: crossover junction endodeoxyribonuclease RuvC [Bacteroidota bacterium]|nr:crossover junction endodeoxyribonuclease RuvC [Bacteroidota bacterium]